VDTRPPLPSSNAGGRLQAPSGPSYACRPVGVGRYAVASRSASAVQKPVSRMPSGSKTRVRSTSPTLIPAARESRMPSTEPLVL
jgi:hypothetical protein